LLGSVRGGIEGTRKRSAVPAIASASDGLASACKC